jgi:hypothetical protein
MWTWVWSRLDSSLVRGTLLSSFLYGLKENAGDSTIKSCTLFKSSHGADGMARHCRTFAVLALLFPHGHTLALVLSIAHPDALPFASLLWLPSRNFYILCVDNLLYPYAMMGDVPS